MAVASQAAARINPKGRLISLQTLANFAAPPVTRGLPHSYEILAVASEGAWTSVTERAEIRRTSVQR